MDLKNGNELATVSGLQQVIIFKLIYIILDTKIVYFLIYNGII